ncbi:tetratricopeptide repeat protein [Streptacidiphilus sp. N1-3]|uniref:Tetratricopeptide repeat protein n=1 Tax=Streptacidiphilus alkalitolerans TaxID=3342712 RepID=A0ABV6WXB8_9ACTN
MERARVVAVQGEGGSGSGYVVGPRLVLTSAHVVVRPGAAVRLFRPGREARFDARVVWCGEPGGRDDAALVHIGSPAWEAWAGGVRWGRLATDTPGRAGETWGVPDVAQRAGRAVEARQLLGSVNPGSGFVANRHVLDLGQHPPDWSTAGSSPWGGLSGAALFCGDLLTGVIAADPAHSAHAALEAVPAYVLHRDAGFRAALAAHGAHAVALEAVEFQELAETAELNPPGLLGSPAALLQAGRQVVPFHGHAGLLDRLRAWRGASGFGAWLLHGPGGQGKTRLAHHMAAELAGEGWAVLWLRADSALQDLDALRQAAKPLLVVVDYAETRTAQIAAVLQAVARHPGTTAFKMLLLARTAGDWWNSAQATSRMTEDLLDGTPVVALRSLEPDPATRAEAYRRAAEAFARALPGVRGHQGTHWTALAANLPAPVVDRAGLDNALTLHMAALADLLDAYDHSGAAPAAPAGSSTEVEDRLLVHEYRYWQQTAAARGISPGLTAGTLQDALAAAMLLGAADREQADRVLRAVEALADQPRDRRDAVLEWIAALYPPTAAGPWGSLQPDRLAERFIGRRLEADASLAHRLTPGCDKAQATRLLAVFSRAAAHSAFCGRLDAALTELCVRNRAVLALAAVDTASRAEYPAPLITALRLITDDPGIPLPDLQRLSDHLPGSSQRLADWAGDLTRCLTNRYRALPEDDQDRLPALAGSLNNLSIRLGALGRVEEALAAIDEAVHIRRALAFDRPLVHLPDLAGSLNNLANRLGALGRAEEALAAVEEAVRIRRVVVVDRPDLHLPDLAGSLNNLATRLGALGRVEEGLAAVDEAVRIRRALAHARPDLYLPDLARSLNNRSNRLTALARHKEALEAVEEAVAIRRVLAGTRPDAYLPDLAGSLNNLSNRLGVLGRVEEGLAAIEESVAAYRALAVVRPDAHLPDLARSLSNQSSRLTAVGREQEALAVIEEAVGIRRALALARPGAYLPGLARSLGSQSSRLTAVGREQEALAVAQEALGIRRVLAGARLGPDGPPAPL